MPYSLLCLCVAVVNKFYSSFPLAALVFIHKSIEDYHFDMDADVDCPMQPSVVNNFCNYSAQMMIIVGATPTSRPEASNRDAGVAPTAFQINSELFHRNDTE